MASFESFPKPPSVSEHDVEDFQDSPELYRLLLKLPKALRQQHLARIVHLEEEEATGYLLALHERREAALRESMVSDTDLAPFFEENKEEIWSALETTVFTDAENLIGHGTTARIQRFDLSEIGGGDAPTLAIKYLVSPTEKTLSVSGEHDLILELEQLRKIEEAEIKNIGADARIRVPHPYFYYRKGKIQCYGMEEIRGVNLEQAMSPDLEPERKAKIQAALERLDTQALMKDVDSFFDTMHGFCLHGDIKPKNLMISDDGNFYVIDFGQSVLTTHVSDKAQSAFEELKDTEKKNTKEIIGYFLNSLPKGDASSPH